MSPLMPVGATEPSNAGLTVVNYKKWYLCRFSSSAVKIVSIEKLTYKYQNKTLKCL